jgi:hypothetical protein
MPADQPSFASSLGLGRGFARSMRILAVLVALAHAAHADPCPRSAPVVIDLEPDAELKELVAWASGVTCSTFVVDPKVAAAAAGRKVTIASPVKLSPDETYDLFVAALATMGLRVAPRANTLRIVEAPRVDGAGAVLSQAGVAGYVIRPESGTDYVFFSLGRSLSPVGSVGTVGRVVFIAERADQLRARLKSRVTAPADEPAEPDDVTRAIEAGIKKIDDTTFEIARSFVDQTISNPMAFMRGARLVPSVTNGKTDGFKIFAIRPTSPYAFLGLYNGDTLTSINGFELTSPDKGLEIYAKLRYASAIELKLLRRGKPVTLKYTIR